MPTLVYALKRRVRRGGAQGIDAKRRAEVGDAALLKLGPRAAGVACDGGVTDGHGSCRVVAVLMPPVWCVD